MKEREKYIKEIYEHKGKRENIGAQIEKTDR